MSWLFASGSQSFGALASASVLPVNVQGWFPLGLTGLIVLLSKRLSRVPSSTIIHKRWFFGAQPSLWSNSHIPYMTTGKTIALTTRTSVGKVMSLLFNILSRFPLLVKNPVCKESACNAGDCGWIPGSERSAGEGISDYPLQYSWVSLVAQLVKNPPTMWETWVQSLGWEDPLDTGKATHSSVLAWRMPWLYSPWGFKESDTTEQLSLPLSLVAQ